ncbi:2Fe-2S iron-sulfur cluster-binding protein [Streptomyces muensis]|uniref:(2Fe-2S)-binding protein n=1 Tax=Streptomyces muensis TaxID=1077944 RepID=A0A9X1PS57_STRM4|nr:2Fe-2S iron-sulfur cluster-binding protein [Streptomyces muensis]MCF1592522.1 (2Fe-2S)-binding protein [Streptomyces muensis]
MPIVTYVLRDGSTRILEVANGSSVMEGAVGNNVPGIDADCGGSASCGTCHVYVDESCRGLFDAPLPEESDLLQCSDAMQSNSRLSCQLFLSDECTEVRVVIPGMG